jgi:hypothetical protein
MHIVLIDIKFSLTDGGWLYRYFRILLISVIFLSAGILNRALQPTKPSGYIGVLNFLQTVATYMNH